MKRLCLLFLSSMLAACASSQIDKFTHADLKNAAKIAATPAHAAVWTAADDFLTAQEKFDAAVAAQAKACVDSLKLTATGPQYGLATAFEQGTALLNKSNPDCTPIPLKLIRLP
jgi:hypothetical protein